MLKHQECKDMANNIDRVLCRIAELKEELEDKNLSKSMEDKFDDIMRSLLDLAYDVLKFDNHFVRKESKFMIFKRKLKVFYIKYLIKKTLKENHENHI